MHVSDPEAPMSLTDPEPITQEHAEELCADVEGFLAALLAEEENQHAAGIITARTAREFRTSLFDLLAR